MKTLTLFFFFVLATVLTINAQITKGNWMVGGSGYFNSVEIKDESGNEINKSFAVGLYPSIGHFFIDKLATGLISQFNYGNTKNGTSNTDFAIGPFVRYYFLKSNEQINILADASYVHYSSNGRIYALKAGPVLYFNSSVGLELTLGFSSTKFSGEFQSNNFRIAIGFQIHLEK